MSVIGGVSASWSKLAPDLGSFAWVGMPTPPGMTHHPRLRIETPVLVRTTCVFSLSKTLLRHRFTNTIASEMSFEMAANVAHSVTSYVGASPRSLARKSNGNLTESLCAGIGLTGSPIYIGQLRTASKDCSRNETC